jgi:hypothetical protein
VSAANGVGGRLALFGAVFLLVVAGGVAFGVTTAPTPADTGVDYPAVDGLVPTELEASDEGVTRVESDERQVVLVDDAHGNRLLPSAYDPLVAAYGSNVEVRFLRDGSQIRSALARADALVVADPSIAFTSEETDAVEAFVDDGGRLVLLGEPTRYRSAGPVGAPLPARSRIDALAGRFGVAFGTGYLYDQSTNDGNFKRVLARGAGPLADRRAALYTATTVRATDGAVLLRTGETTRASDGSGVGARPVAIRSGNVLAVGDTTFLEGTKDLVADNERLVRTVAQFAVDGTRERSLAAYPHLLDRAPRVRYTAPTLLNASKTAANDLRDEGFGPRLSRGVAGMDGTDLLLATYDDLGERTSWTGVTVTGTQVSVPGYRGATANSTVVHQPRGTDTVVVVGPSATTVERAVAVLVAGEIRRESLSDRTAVLRDGNTTSGGDGPDDAGGDPGGDGGERPTGPTPAPSLAPRAPVR